jgi:YD repeat-containing protein
MYIFLMYSQKVSRFSDVLRFFVICWFAPVYLVAGPRLGNVDLRGQLTQNYMLGGIGDHPVILDAMIDVVVTAVKKDAKPVFVTVWNLPFTATRFEAEGRSGWQWQTVEGDIIAFSQSDAERGAFRADGWRLRMDKVGAPEETALIENRQGEAWQYKSGQAVEYKAAGGRKYRFIYKEERLSEVISGRTGRAEDSAGKNQSTVWLHVDYDAQGRVAALVVGPNKHTFTYAEGPRAVLTAWSANAQEPVRFTYKDGLLAGVTRGADKQTFTWAEGARGMPVLAADDESTYTWTPSKDMLETYTLTRTDKLGRKTELLYIGPRGETVAITPDGARTTTLINRRGKGRGQLGSVIAPDGSERVKIDYNERHLPIARREPGRPPVLLTYDALDRVTEVKAGDRVIQRMRYLAEDAEPSQVINALREIMDFTYDGARRLIVKSGPYRPDEQGRVPADVSTVTYSHDEQGRTVRAETSTGVVAEARYDEYDRKIWSKGPDGFVREYIYGANSRLAELHETPPGAVKPVVLTFGYDLVGRVTEVTRDTRTVESWVYDDQAVAADHVRRVTRTDAYGAKTVQGFDAQGNVTVETNAAGEITRYRYDVAGQLTGWTDGRGGEVNFKRDELGRIIEQRNSAKQVLRFAYDLSGRTTVRDNGVNPASFAYDGAGRPESITYSPVKAAPQVVRYTYDNEGRRSRSQTNEVTTVLTYDDLDRVVRREQHFPQGRSEAVTYRFDVAGRRTELATLRRETPKEAWKTLQTTAYTYDVRGRLAEMRTDGTLAARYAYDATTGRLATKTFGNGTVVGYTYDDYGRETRVEIRSAEGQAVRAIDYLFDPLGRPSGRRVYAQAQAAESIVPVTKLVQLEERTYVYDPLGRLAAVEVAGQPAKTERYAYDQSGNLARKQLGGTLTTFEYDLANQLAKKFENGVQTVYRYDEAGRLVSEWQMGKDPVTYVYGYLDKVMSVSRAEPGARPLTTKFLYDATGMLVAKERGGAAGVAGTGGLTESWVWDGMALLARGDELFTNEAHITGGLPVYSREPDAGGAVSSAPTVGVVTP